MIKNRPSNAGGTGSILGWENPLNEEMPTHSNILAWEVQWTEEPDGLESMGSRRIGHNLVTKQLQLLTLIRTSYSPKDLHDYFVFLLDLSAPQTKSLGRFDPFNLFSWFSRQKMHSVD